MEDNIEEETILADLDGKGPRQVRVLDLIDISVPRADKETRQERMSICRGCDKFKMNSICSECNCVMPLKTWLSPATCPLNKW